jgi:hypothetical protein
MTWERVNIIDDYASQGKVWIDETSNDILLAYEKSDNGDYVQINHYNTLRLILSLNHNKIFTMPRTLSEYAEGTPSFKHVFKQGRNITNSEIHLKHNYFQDGIHDQQASCIIKNFKGYNCQAFDKLNSKVQQLGFMGNIGSRQQFQWEGKTYNLLEAAGCFDCWDTWRIMLCDENMKPLMILPMKTPLGSKSFANPNIIVTNRNGKKQFVISMFMPLEGNDLTEFGNLIYSVDVPTLNNNCEDCVKGPS